MQRGPPSVLERFERSAHLCLHRPAQAPAMEVGGSCVVHVHGAGMVRCGSAVVAALFAGPAATAVLFWLENVACTGSRQRRGATSGVFAELPNKATLIRNQLRDSPNRPAYRPVPREAVLGGG